MERGELARAEEYFRKALSMRRALFPPKDYPEGHPDLALSLNQLGGVILDRGDAAGDGRSTLPEPRGAGPEDEDDDPRTGGRALASTRPPAPRRPRRPPAPPDRSTTGGPPS